MTFEIPLTYTKIDPHEILAKLASRSWNSDDFRIRAVCFQSALGATCGFSEPVLEWHHQMKLHRRECNKCVLDPHQQGPGAPSGGRLLLAVSHDAGAEYNASN